MIKIGQNRNKIDNIKILINLVTELKSYLKRYLKRELYLKVVTQQQSKHKFRRRKGVPKVPPPKKTTCYSHKLYNYKFRAADEGTSRLYLKSPLKRCQTC